MVPAGNAALLGSHLHSVDGSRCRRTENAAESVGFERDVLCVWGVGLVHSGRRKDVSGRGHATGLDLLWTIRVSGRNFNLPMASAVLDGAQQRLLGARRMIRGDRRRRLARAQPMPRRMCSHSSGAGCNVV